MACVIAGAARVSTKILSGIPLLVKVSTVVTKVIQGECNTLSGPLVPLVPFVPLAPFAPAAPVAPAGPAGPAEPFEQLIMARLITRQPAKTNGKCFMVANLNLMKID